MRYIAITREAFLPSEAEAVALLLDGGFARVHLRKSAATEEQMRAFIERLPGRLYDRLTLHDRHELAAEYGLGGVHLNGRNPQPPADFRGTVSRSCHSLEELQCCRTEDYLFLSPIYDSLSKAGYRAAFTAATLRQAAVEGTVGPRVVALGGVTPARIPELSDLGFGGAAFLGYIWGDGSLRTIERNLKEITCCNS